MRELRYRLNVNSMHRERDATEIGMMTSDEYAWRTTHHLLRDDYCRNRTSGIRLGAGMVNEGR
jgi:hypothetical protein